MNNKIISGDGVRVAQPLFPVEGQGSIPMSPLQLNIKHCPLSLAKKLNKRWHSKLPDYKTGFMPISMACFTAEFKNIYYAVAIWNNPSSPSFSNRNFLELRRMAISQDAPFNTASRMIKIMVSMIKKDFPLIERLISYQDTSVHKGTIYKASGWIKGCESIKTIKLYGKARNQKTTEINFPKIRWEKQIRPEPKQEVAAKRIEKERSQLKLFT